MNKKKICYIVDHPVRDLPSAILTSIELRSKFKVYLINFYQYYELFFINPDIVFLNHVRDDYDTLLKILKKLKKKVVVHEQEGGYFGPNNLDYFKFIKKNYEKNSYFDLFFIWGKKHFKIVSNYQEFKEFKHKFILSGTPRIDVLKFYKKNNTKEVFDILYNLNSNSVNPKYGQNKYKNFILDINFKSKYSLPLIVRRRIIKIHQNIKNIIYLSRYCKVLVRPHPFEDENVYINFFKNNENISISMGSSLSHDMNISKVIISSYCQTVFDSVILKKPHISLAYLDKLANYRICPIRYVSSLNIYSQKEFNNNVKKIIKTKFLFKNVKKFQDIIYNYNTFSFKKISYEISKLKLSKSKIKLSNFFTFLLSHNFLEINKIIFIILFGLKNYLFLTKIIKNKKNISKFFTVDDCNDIIKEYDSFNNRKFKIRKISLKDYSSKLFFIKSDTIIIE